jgi:hypothetical protein
MGAFGTRMRRSESRMGAFDPKMPPDPIDLGVEVP